MDANRLFCFGLGYSALRLAEILRTEGWRVAGTTRDAEKAEALRARGLEAFIFSPGRPLENPGQALAGASHVLSSVPPGPEGDPVLAAHAADLADAAPLWTGYLSTTGVYGDRGGGWVDEDSPLEPATGRGRRRLAAEAGWRNWAADAQRPLCIFRLAGIYGPGRNALRTVAEGRAKRIEKPGQVFSRIHVEDIARVLRASMARPGTDGVFNVCDDEPAPPADPVTFACELLGVEPPPLVPFEEAARDMPEMGRSFYAESKRCRNDRIKKALGVTLKYPTYREGLRALFEAGEGQPGK
ncbi:MAG: SDR family oxidoreductase [Alphaproteobacteria bacterium]